ncbi:MAG: hypothetical protein DME33_14450 [Verrucomicrobia bacterium]|nr:MAG: hypothetical protein DME33_14450 [Verrucomicrobiota bacterium]
MVGARTSRKCARLAAQKNLKKFKKKLATALALQLEGKLARLTGLPSVQKKFKKKLVRLQKV